MRGSDQLLLMAAVELAEAGRYTCAPNPTVGCIIVRNDQIIGRGFHARAGEGHAEVQAIAAAGGDVAGATVYVSLEPCAYVGRTPACAQTLIDARVARVVAAAVDPHPAVSGKGLKMLQAAGIETELLVLPEAEQAIRGFASRIGRERPWVRLKTASSLDGAVALANGESQWITGEAARQDVQHLRARSDAIITGVGTVLRDDPLLTVRLTQPCRAPLRVVLDSQARTPQDARMLNDSYTTAIVHDPATTVSYGDHVTCLARDPRDLDGVLHWLGEQGCNEALVEAGPAVVGSFLKQRLWDEWVAYLAPKVLGSNSQQLADFALDSLAQAPGARIESVTRVGADLKVTLVPSDE